MKQKEPRNGVRPVSKASALVRAVFAGALLTWGSTLAYGSPAVIEKIETANAVLSFKSGSGDLIGVQWKHPKLDLIKEPRLGENFRLLLPLPDYEANYFNSRDQVVRKIDKTPTGVVLHYGPLKNERQEVNVKVDYEIRDTGAPLCNTTSIYSCH